VGAVSSHARDLLSNLKQDAGFGVSYRRNALSLARIDVGFGGGEGHHIFLGFGLGL
jgi:outer membrane translocation and assembly module TamA